MPEQCDLDADARYIDDHLRRNWFNVFTGMHYQGVAFEPNPSREFPDLLMFFTIDGSEGERVHRRNYSVDGRQYNASDAATDLYTWSMENKDSYYRRQPLSGR